MTHEARNKAIADEYLNTERTLEEIGTDYGMTRERVRQIVKEVYPNQETPTERRKRIREEKLAEVWKAVETATTMREVAERTGIDENVLQRWATDYPKYAGLRQRVKRNREKVIKNRTHWHCKKCDTVKPITEFSPGGKYHHYYCKACNAKKARAYAENMEPVDEPTVDEKVCPGCMQNLPASNFHRATKTKTGLQTYCKECLSRLNKGETVKEVRESHGYPYERIRTR